MIIDSRVDFGAPQNLIGLIGRLQSEVLNQHRASLATDGGARVEWQEDAPPGSRSGTVPAETTHEDAPPGARRSGITSTEERQRQPKVELISWKPRVAVLHDFLNGNLIPDDPNPGFQISAWLRLLSIACMGTSNALSGCSCVESSLPLCRT
jgi:hypothetical protein